MLSQILSNKTVDVSKKWEEVKMKLKVNLVMVVFLLLTSRAFGGQSLSCFPEHVTFASNGGSVNTVEKTTVNWKRIDYHIVDNAAIAMTYKDVNDPATNINPIQRDELAVIEASSDKVVLMGGKMDSPMWLTVDVIFPKDGNGYSFYVSDYPKTLKPDKSDLVNLSKLYMLKCKDISQATK